MKIIKSIFQRMKGDSLARKMTEVRREKEYSHMHTVKSGVVFWIAGGGEQPGLETIREKFPEVKMDKVCFLPANYQGLQVDDVVYVKAEDVGFGGKIMNDKLFHVLEKPYDLLIDLTRESNVLVDYVLKNSQAKCKVGMEKEGFEADIVLKGISDPVVFIGELAKLLSDLKEY
ncbi:MULTISPECIES: DUF6913 domain-containing protein [Culturomica]|jgi:hypothetical protein|uniref:DUF6913 domain-containing protein n=1 Tax=Culturomica TaxID=1926651 RepID=UPI000E9F641E|nr:MULTISPECIES: hypothetical protein [Culturomica]HBO27954.1 hypothetical protein [Culturomica sp.]